MVTDAGIRVLMEHGWGQGRGLVTTFRQDERLWGLPRMPEESDWTCSELFQLRLSQWKHLRDLVPKMGPVGACKAWDATVVGHGRKMPVLARDAPVSLGIFGCCVLRALISPNVHAHTACPEGAPSLRDVEGGAGLLPIPGVQALCVGAGSRLVRVLRPGQAFAGGRVPARPALARPGGHLGGIARPLCSSCSRSDTSVFLFLASVCPR